MPTDSPADRLTLALYRQAHELPEHHFPEWALALLREILPFDSACWTSASLVDGVPRVSGIHYFGLPALPGPEHRHTACCPPPDPHHAGRSRCLPAAAPPPAPTIAPGPAPLWPTLHTPWLDPGGRFLECIGLHRPVGRDFNETERALKQRLMPHLVESRRLNRQRQLRDEVLQIWEATHSTATADRFGVLHDAETRFVELLRTEWPGWRGARLPDVICQQIRADGRWEYRGRRVLLRCWPLPESELRLLVASAQGAAAALSRREYQIAHAYASGQSYRAIADQLHIAPVTVRNHVAAIYRKLGVSSKAGLWRMLQTDGVLLAPPREDNPP